MKKITPQYFHPDPSQASAPQFNEQGLMHQDMQDEVVAAEQELEQIIGAKDGAYHEYLEQSQDTTPRDVAMSKSTYEANFINMLPNQMISRTEGQKGIGSNVGQSHQESLQRAAQHLHKKSFDGAQNR